MLNSCRNVFTGSRGTRTNNLLWQHTHGLCHYCTQTKSNWKEARWLIMSICSGLVIFKMALDMFVLEHLISGPFIFNSENHRVSTSGLSVEWWLKSAVAFTNFQHYYCINVFFFNFSLLYRNCSADQQWQWDCRDPGNRWFCKHPQIGNCIEPVYLLRRCTRKVRIFLIFFSLLALSLRASAQPCGRAVNLVSWTLRWQN